MPTAVFRRLEAVALLVVAAVAAVPYGLAVSRYWNISPDSATYVGGAQSLVAGTGYALLGRPIHLQPPLTSLVYAATLWVSPEGYLGLRVVTVAFLLAGLVVAFFLARCEVGSRTSLVVVTASLGSAFLLQESTRLLSEMFYLFFSLGALLVAMTTRDDADGWRSALLLGAAMLLAAMTRTIGLVLPGAVLACHAIRVARSRARFRPRMVAAAVLVLAASVLWDQHGRSEGVTYFALLGQKQIWVEEAGTLSPLGVVSRLLGQLPEIGRVGAILTNGVFERWELLSVASTWVATGLFLLGLGISCARGVTPMNLYLVLYVLVCLSWGEVVSRFFVPVMPLLFLYAFVALRTCLDRFGAERGRVAFGVGLALWGGVSAHAAWPVMRAEIAEQHDSPFGVYPIKYRWNYDAERLALWLRDHTEGDVAYASPFPDVYDLISERTSIPLPLTHDPDAFLATLDAHRVAYVLLSLKEGSVEAYAVPAISRHPERFRLIAATPAAQLYEYRAR